MVARGKPAPDLFLHAARTLGEKPESCVVVEDSPYGVKAAVAAGMAVIGFTGGSHCGPATSRALQAAGAGVVAASAEDVSKAYRSIARR
jgi:beta-phosphoglucomutase-like phosphatase (HAD superfamily)